MRQLSRVKVVVRGRVIGGACPLVCLPLVAEDRDRVLEQATLLCAMEPDLLEWRVDAYQQVADVRDCLSLLEELRGVIGELPLIFTCRIESEGGLQPISREIRLALLSGVMESGLVDLVDVELCNDEEFCHTVRTVAAANGVKLILSHHNFTLTPDADFICNTLEKAAKSGADIAKIAVMPKDYGDVLTLLTATNRARNGAVDIPMITISMGEEGMISRLAGGLFGSDITFGLGTSSSAPGQLPVAELKKGMALFYKKE